MGKRKLKFDVRKNCERKRKKPLELCPATCSLLVSLPISAYLSAEAADTALLHSRIVALQSLPPGWMFANIHSNASLVIYKLQPVAAAAGLVFTVSLDHAMMWEVKVGDSVVSVRDCEFLNAYGYPLSPLSSVQKVVRLLARLDEATICIGNADPKYFDLVTNHEGCFKDPTGMCIS